VASESPFTRAVSAWNAGRSSKVVSIAKRGLDAVARGAGFLPRADPSAVLWLSPPGAFVPPATVASISCGHIYRIEHVVTGPGTDPRALLQDRHPRMMVVDVDWCAYIGVETVRRLHRLRPEIDWLLCWDAPSPVWLDTLVHSGARGAVARGAEAETLARAFDAVVSGQLWLPRQVMQWLYATIVEPPNQDQPWHSSSAREGPSTSPWADSDLTPRELEVAELMRRGLTNHDIAERLGVSVNTVKKHLSSTYEKQGLRNRRQTRF
jgi:two-component system, NarL family, nitrate/nitrite response regulator NarL